MSAYTAMTRSETRLFFREPLAVFWTCVFPVALLCIFGLIPSFREVGPDTGVRMLDVYVPVMILMSMTFVAVTGVGTELGTSRERRILKRLATTPAGWRLLMAAQFTLNTVIIVAVAAVVLTVGRAVFAVPLPANPAAYALVIVLTTTALLSLGLLIGALSPSAKVASAVGSMAFFPLMFFGGLWLPVQVMPDLLRSVSEFTPLGAASSALHAASLGDWPAAEHLLVLVACAVVLAAAAVRWFRWE